MGKDGTPFTPPDFRALEDMSDSEKLDEILTTMRELRVGFMQFTEQLKESPMAKMFLKGK